MKRPSRARRQKRPSPLERAALYAGDATEHADLVRLLSRLDKPDPLIDRLHVLGEHIDGARLAQVMDLVTEMFTIWTESYFDEHGNLREPSTIMMLLGAAMFSEITRMELTNSLTAAQKLKLPLLYECIKEVAISYAEDLESRIEPEMLKQTKRRLRRR